MKICKTANIASGEKKNRENEDAFEYLKTWKSDFKTVWERKGKIKVSQCWKIRETVNIVWVEK